MPQAVLRMILVPSLITLAVTLLRLAGELRGWSEVLFRRSAGGFGAVVGITWLAFVFALYFAFKLGRVGDVPVRPARSILLAILALVLTFSGLNVMYYGAPNTKPLFQATGAVVILIALYFMRSAWPSYSRILMAYAIASRVPVIAIMYLAMRGDWGTHYDAIPPDVSYPDWPTKFIQAGLIPQVFLWIPFTVILCGLFGMIALALLRRRDA
jgi:hypothetical protein